MSFNKDIKFAIEEPTSVPIHQVHISPKGCAGGLCCISPHPDARRALLDEFKKEGKGHKSFYEWVREKGLQPSCPNSRIQAEELAARREVAMNTGIERVDVPQNQIKGDVYLNVLLVKFPGSEPKASSTKEHFKELLFSEGVLPNGSLRDYYREVTQGKVTIKGFVSDWLMMPNPKTYYTNKDSALGSFPKNGAGLMTDAVKVALANGVKFPPELDFKKNGTVGACYIFATGRGAEQTAAADDIWSHKASFQQFQVGRDLVVRNGLLVPEDAEVGVCAHELGHLAFEWDDFYDVDSDDGSNWQGSGDWDLMASGSWNRATKSGDLPAPPAALHRIQHNWLDVTTIGQTTKGLVLPPHNSKQAKAVVVKSNAYSPSQSLILENRSTTKGYKYDKGLPGSGLLVWKVDTDQSQEKPLNPGMSLLQADKLNDLELDKDSGDAGDPFPGTSNNKSVPETGGPINTSFEKKSGITLQNIRLDPSTQNITVDVVYKNGMEPFDN